MGYLRVHSGYDIWDTTADAVVVTVNCIGIMGKGIAKECKERYPEVFWRYKDECAKRLWQPGQVRVYRTDNGRFVILAATKSHWRYPSEEEWVRECVQRLAFLFDKTNYNFRSIALPALGCGNGGLDPRWFVEYMSDNFGIGCPNRTNFELYVNI